MLYNLVTFYVNTNHHFCAITEPVPFEWHILMSWWHISSTGNFNIFRATTKTNAILCQSLTQTQSI